MFGEILFREFAGFGGGLKAKESVLCIRLVLVDTILVDPELFLVNHPLVVADVDRLHGHPVLDFPVLRDVDIDGIAYIDVVSALLPMILSVLLQAFSQTECATLSRDKPLLMVFRDDVSGHIHTVVVRDNVQMTVHSGGDTAKNVETGRIFTLLDSAQIGSIDVGKLCHILSIHTSLHPKTLDFCPNAFTFVLAVRAIPEDTGPAAALVHTTKNRPHNDRWVALVVFVEECSDYLAVLLLHFKWDYSGESQRETVTLWRFNRHLVQADELTFCIYFHNSATGLTLEHQELLSKYNTLFWIYKFTNCIIIQLYVVFEGKSRIQQGLSKKVVNLYDCIPGL